MAKNEPRKHHFINAAMLAGFTLRGGQRDNLHAVDLRRRIHRSKSSPRKEGFRNDYYKISAPGVDPNAVEKLFGRDVEPHFAALLRDIRDKGQLPTDQKGYGALISLIAVLATRVPHTRKMMEQGYSQTFSLLDRMTREHYPMFQKSMRDIGEDESLEAFEQYRKDCEELDQAGGRWTVDSTTLVMEEMKLAAGIFDVLYERSWTLLVSRDPTPISSARTHQSW